MDDDIRSIRKRLNAARQPSASNIMRRDDDVPVGSMNVISSNYESLDYDTCENALYLEEERKKGYAYVVKKDFARWLVFLLIGIFTAFVGIFIDIAIEELANVKFAILKSFLDDSVLDSTLYIPYGIWIASNIVPVLIGSFLVTYMEPVAAGSGIPQVKCYLNGIKMPRIVRIRTLIVKSIGVITSVVGGLAAGKEGPMIHSGAVVAAGISQGKTTSLNKDFQIFKYFREDHEKRDFVSGGAAAGVAAAFGAPVGGVLFSLEEGASFWNQSLTWRIFFASMISTFTLNVVLSAYHGFPGVLSYPGLLNFGKFETLCYQVYELPLFIGMGAIGGLSGALFIHLNYKLTIFRMRYLREKYMRVIESMIVSGVSATIAIFMIHFVSDCKPLGLDPTKYPVQMYCPDGEYNALASVFLQVPEASVRSFFHDPIEAIEPLSLAFFVIAYWVLSTWTYGLSVSAGLFIPSILTGAAWGRLVGLALNAAFPDAEWIDVGKYALVGAAAQLGGAVRMTISLTVILIEATGNITFGLPIMITVITAKWIGDFFTEGIYDTHIQLGGIPLLAWDPPPLSSNIVASAVMSYPVVTFRTVESVGFIMDTLAKETHNAFPIVDNSYGTAQRYGDGEPISCGHLRGLILRSQLIVLMKNKVFVERANVYDQVCVDTFRQEYPRYPSIERVQISEADRKCTMDLTDYMNPSPYVTQHVASLPRVFRLFRALGLRHLIVVNDANQVVGVVTRKDLTRYKVSKHFGRISVEEMKVTDLL